MTISYGISRERTGFNRKWLLISSAAMYAAYGHNTGDAYHDAYSGGIAFWACVQFFTRNFVLLSIWIAPVELAAMLLVLLIKRLGEWGRARSMRH